MPKGYVCIRVDARGVGNSPGLQAPFSVQQAEDYYDAIEWAGTQPWSNGNVGLWGMSYLAITQHTVASLQPPHLKAMIALGTDADLYNEAIYGGGLFGEGFWTWWRGAMAGHNYIGERRETDWLARMLATPFNDPEAYGTARVDLHAPRDREGDRAGVDRRPADRRRHPPARQQRDLPPLDRRAGEEVRLRRRLVPAQLQGVDDRRAHAFFDHWLKGVDNGVMDGAPVRVQVRTGNGGHYVSEENEWPIARTDVPALVPRRDPVGLDGRRSPQRLPAHQPRPCRPPRRSRELRRAPRPGPAHPGADRLRRRHPALVDRRLLRQRAARPRTWCSPAT